MKNIKLISIISSLILAVVALSGCITTHPLVSSSPSPTSEPIPTAQIMEMTMPIGSISTSSVSYTNYLKAGENIKGFVRLTGICPAIDWDSTCYIKIFDPKTNYIYRQSAKFREGGLYHEFSIWTRYEGEYRLQVQHLSNYSRMLHIEIYPLGWRYSGE